jgi:hypothetical protein
MLSCLRSSIHPSIASNTHLAQHQKFNIKPQEMKLTDQNRSTSTPAAQTPSTPPDCAQKSAHKHPGPCPSSCTDWRRTSDTRRSTRRPPSRRLSRRRAGILDSRRRAPTGSCGSRLGDLRCRGLGAGSRGGGGLCLCTFFACGLVLMGWGWVRSGDCVCSWLAGGFRCWVGCWWRWRVREAFLFFFIGA